MRGILLDESAPVQTNTRCNKHRVSKVGWCAGAEVAQHMDRDQSTPTSGSNTSLAVEGAAPSLAYVNPQPRLPHSEASPPEQPETFMRRARRVRLGSHRLKLWYLALCTFGRAWTRDDNMLEIGIKQQSLAGELETKLNRVSKVLTELVATGLVHVRRRKYHSRIRIFLTPQARAGTPEKGVPEVVQVGPVTPEKGVTEVVQVGSDTPERGVTENPDTPEKGVTNVFSTYVQQQQQHRAGAREATEKQLSGITSMAAELGITAPEVHGRLAADVAFRELRERVEAQRNKGRGKDGAKSPPRRHRIVAALNAGGQCEVCGERQPDPKGRCPGERRG